MKIVITGAAGFLGWHIRLRLHSMSDYEVIPVTRVNWHKLSSLLTDADGIIHLAGVNRGTDEEVLDGNVTLARDVARAVQRLGRPLRVVYAGTIKERESNSYGVGKRNAGEILAEATVKAGGSFAHVVLPNLFGEHSRPYYNAFTATFIDHLIKRTHPEISEARLGLLHAQDAAQYLINALHTSDATVEPASKSVSVTEVWTLLQEFHETYITRGDFPSLASKFKVDLFNTYRAALFPSHYPIGLAPHTDSRGSFVETVRSHGGEGQTSFSTTVPGVTRGEHYHLSKIERFVVIQGKGTIELRRMFTDQIYSFEVDGSSPVAIDMPTGWVHNITNTGDDLLLTQFWTHELFRPDNPDTFAEKVRLKDSQS